MGAGIRVKGRINALHELRLDPPPRQKTQLHGDPSCRGLLVTRLMFTHEPGIWGTCPTSRKNKNKSETFVFERDIMVR